MGSKKRMPTTAEGIEQNERCGRRKHGGFYLLSLLRAGKDRSLPHKITGGGGMKVYTSAAVAKKLGITKREVEEMTACGVIRDGRYNEKLYKMEETARELIAEYRKPEEKRETVDYTTERAKLMRIKRLNEEFDLQLRERELHRTEDIEMILSKMIVAFKARIDAIPAKAAPVVAKMTDSADVFDKIKELTDEALRDLSDFDLVFGTEEEQKQN